MKIGMTANFVVSIALANPLSKTSNSNPRVITPIAMIVNLDGVSCRKTIPKNGVITASRLASCPTFDADSRFIA